MGNAITELARIQHELKAPKSQRNSFGNYNYRSAEDILEAVKPLLGSNVITLSDEIQLVGDRYYICAHAVFWSGEGDSFGVTACAREEETKKGMDASQITGSASSYARKYALNGLLCIDDTKDSDFTNTGTKEPEKSEPKQGREQMMALQKLEKMITPEQKTALEKQKGKALKEWTIPEIAATIKKIEERNNA